MRTEAIVELDVRPAPRLSAELHWSNECVAGWHCWTKRAYRCRPRRLNTIFTATKQRWWWAPPEADYHYETVNAGIDEMSEVAVGSKVRLASRSTPGGQRVRPPADNAAARRRRSMRGNSATVSASCADFISGRSASTRRQNVTRLCCVSLSICHMLLRVYTVSQKTLTLLFF